jgi:hypothetical protein
VVGDDSVESSSATSIRATDDTLGIACRRGWVPVAGWQPAGVVITPIRLAVAMLVLAQIIGLFGLLSRRRADVVLSVIMFALLLAALAVGGLAAYHKIA